MLSAIARLVLVATSLSPILGAVAVNEIARGQRLAAWLPWVIIAILLVVTCWFLLLLEAQEGERYDLTIHEFERSDQEVLTFLLAYLLPFISSDNLSFGKQWIVGAYVLAIVFIVIAHAGAFHFNPVMGLLGYHFYGLKNEHGVSQLLISRKELRRNGVDIKTVQLAYNIYLQVE